MKIFEIVANAGYKFEVGIDEEPYISEHLDNYLKELRVVFLKVDGVEVPKDSHSGRPFLCEFAYTWHQGKRDTLIIRIAYDAWKFIKKLKDLPSKNDGVALLCSPELKDYYKNVYQPAAEAKIAQLKAEKAAAIQEAFEALTDDTEIEVSYHTSYGYSVFGDHGKAGKHEWFKKCFGDLKSTRIEIPDEYITSTDWGDYSINYDYKLPFGELEKLYQQARDILEPQERKAAEEKAAREAYEASLKAAVKCEILKTGKVRGEDGSDLYAIVRMTNLQTGESLEFTCRNVFDVGYVINPNYAVAKGLSEGGLANKGKWQDFEASKGGWYDVRELTDFEKRCMEYLRELPPVANGIRM